MTPPGFASDRLRRLAGAAPRAGETPTGGVRQTDPERQSDQAGRGDRGRQTDRKRKEDRERREERCDLCAEPLQAEHRHLLDVTAGALSCACRACALLFDRKEAGGTSYRLVPQRRLRLEGSRIDDVLWAGLGIPVDLAFFVRASGSGEVTAGYPSPLGALRSTVDPQTWRALEIAHPAVSGLADDVEALLVNRAGGAHEQWLVPLDDCYRLVALVRAHWKGLGGGAEVWAHVDTFFRQLPGQLSAGQPSAAPTPVSEEATTWPRSR